MAKSTAPKNSKEAELLDNRFGALTKGRKAEWADTALILVTLCTIAGLLMVVLTSLLLSGMHFQNDDPPELAVHMKERSDKDLATLSDFPDDLVIWSTEERKEFQEKVRLGEQHARSLYLIILHLEPTEPIARQHLNRFVARCHRRFASVSVFSPHTATNRTDNANMLELLMQAKTVLFDVPSHLLHKVHVVVVSHALEGPVSFLGFMSSFAPDTYELWTALTAYGLIEPFHTSLPRVTTNDTPFSFCGGPSFYRTVVDPEAWGTDQRLLHSLWQQVIVPSPGKDRFFSLASYFGGISLFKAEPLEQLSLVSLLTEVASGRDSLEDAMVTLQKAMGFHIHVNPQFCILYFHHRTRYPQTESDTIFTKGAQVVANLIS